MIKKWSKHPKWGIAIHIGAGQPPVYQQIVEQVRFHIACGNIQEGEKLPTVRELAAALEINFNTVGKAYHELAREGVILGRKGVGCFVSERGSIPQDEKKKKLGDLCRRLISEAASYGLSASELKSFIQKEKFS